jgi:hypothetical protein
MALVITQWEIGMADYTFPVWVTLFAILVSCFDGDAVKADRLKWLWSAVTGVSAAPYFTVCQLTAPFSERQCYWSYRRSEAKTRTRICDDRSVLCFGGIDRCNVLKDGNKSTSHD